MTLNQPSKRRSYQKAKGLRETSVVQLVAAILAYGSYTQVNHAGFDDDGFFYGVVGVGVGGGIFVLCGVISLVLAILHWRSSKAKRMAFDPVAGFLFLVNSVIFLVVSCINLQGA